MNSFWQNILAEQYQLNHGLSRALFRFLTFNPMHDKRISCDTKLPLTSISTSYMDMSISDFISDKVSPLLLISGPCVIEKIDDKRGDLFGDLFGSKSCTT
jgi:hypothetical protein